MAVYASVFVRRDQRLMACLAVAASAAALLCATFGLESAFAYGGPLFVLLLPLLAGRFVGEERIARAVERRRCSRAVRPRSAAPMPVWRDVVLMPRGGTLIASALAVRPPPFSAA